jgi:glycine/D-amino acid oxidase-like deaminating enzyme
MQDTVNPAVSSYPPTWYSATMVATPARAPLTYDVDVDVCVIGGGLAGLTTARELARRGRSVVLLEARRIAWSASGANDGFVLPGFAESMDDVIERVGFDHARELWSLAEMGFEYVRTAIAEAEMPGVAATPGWLKPSKVDKGDALIDTIALYEKLGWEAEGWPTERVRAVLKSDHYFHALHLPQAFHIHPLNYALGLAAAAEASGARIFEDTPALAIDVEGVRKRVETRAGRVRAAHIVLACSAHLGALLPRIAGTLIPAWSYVVTTAPLGPRVNDAIAYRGAVSDGDLANHHYRVVPGSGSGAGDNDRLLWSGGATTWEVEARRMVPSLQNDIAALYPQLGKVEIEHAWSALLAHALHRMPQIGELAPGLWLASAFGGQGINTTAMAGIILAQAIGESDDTWRLFAPFELVWAGGPLGRAAMQAYFWWIDARDRFKAKEARGREQDYRRAAQLAGMRTAEEPASGEAQVGAVVPREQLPQEPAAGELPADPVGAEDRKR